MAQKRVETAANIITDIETLKKTIYTGNGEPSLTNQVSSLTTKVEYLEKSLHEKLDHTKTCIEGKIEGLSDTIHDRDIENRHDESRRNKIIASLIAGIISIAIAIVSYMVS